MTKIFTKVPVSHLVDALTGALPMVSRDKIAAPGIQHVHLTSWLAGLVVESTDRFRAIRAEIITPVAGDDGFDVLLSTATVKELIKWLKLSRKNHGKDCLIRLEQEEDVLIVAVADVDFEFIELPVGDGDFPAIERLFKDKKEDRSGETWFGFLPSRFKGLDKVPALGTEATWAFTLCHSEHSARSLYGVLQTNHDFLSWKFLAMTTRLGDRVYGF